MPKLRVADRRSSQVTGTMKAIELATEGHIGYQAYLIGRVVRHFRGAAIGDNYEDHIQKAKWHMDELIND